MGFRKLITSSLSQEITRDGFTFAVRISRPVNEAHWTLMVTDQTGASYLWEAPFASDCAALVTARKSFGSAGERGPERQAATRL